MARQEKQSRRARGSGSLFWHEARGVWVGRIPNGTYPSGVTRYMEVSDPKQAGCLAKMQSVSPPTPGITVGEWSERWLRSLTVRPLTRDGYARNVRLRIVPALGHLQIRELNPHHCELAVQQWLTDLAPPTVKIVLAHLSILCRAAVRAGLITTNPVSSVPKVKLTRRRNRAAEIFTAADLARIIAAATTPEARPVALVAATGLRVGELVALDVTDYNPATGELSISKGDILQHGIGPPKSDASYRTIHVPATVRPIVRAARGGRTAGPLFLVDGRRQTRSAIYWQWRLILDRCGLPQRGTHAVRHALASAMNHAGVPLADAAKYLGHELAVYVSTYCHASRIDPSGTIDKLLSQKNEKVKMSNRKRA